MTMLLRSRRTTARSPAPVGRRVRRRLAIPIAVLTALALVVAACGDDDASGSASDDGATSPPPGSERLLDQVELASEGAPVTYVGSVDGTDAFIAVVTADDGTAVAYVCDGQEISTWFTGTLDEGGGTLSDASGDARVVVEGTGDTLTGTVTAGGEDRPFSAPAALPGGDTLYRLVDDSNGEASVTGWILYGDAVRGFTKQGREVAGTVAVDDIETVGSEEVPPGADEEPALKLFPKLRCRKKARDVAAAFQGLPGSGDTTEVMEDFLSFGCSSETFLGPGFDSTDGLCLLYGLPPEQCGTIG